jgi:hypothetical protein
MVTVNTDPDAGGNMDQPEDGRDEEGRLPEPLDSARFPDGALDLPGMPLSQPAGTGAVISTPPAIGEPDEGGNVEQPDAEVNERGELAPPVDAEDYPGAGQQPQQDPKAQESVGKPTGVLKRDADKNDADKTDAKSKTSRRKAGGEAAA